MVCTINFETNKPHTKDHITTYNIRPDSIENQYNHINIIEKE
jgi:hypothetical protein